MFTHSTLFYCDYEEIASYYVGGSFPEVSFIAEINTDLEKLVYAQGESDSGLFRGKLPPPP